MNANRRGRVLGCLACGSNRLRRPTATESRFSKPTVFGMIGSRFNSWMICDQCGNIGEPLEFDDEGSRLAFVAAQVATAVESKRS